MTRFYTKSELCELFAISDTTLERIVARGELRPVIISRRMRFEQSEVERYIESCRVNPKPAPVQTPRQKQQPRTAYGINNSGYYPGMKVV